MNSSNQLKVEFADGENNEKMLRVKKLECASFQISPKGDLFKPVKNGYMLERTINFLLHENQSLEHALEELRMEKESLMNDVQKLLMGLEGFSNNKEKNIPTEFQGKT
ncbi:hypothetical protein [Listeria marthii]|uniref:hypothetical protein n=1 Tax=Listeria marthii TaxID=529731 RepID=UPI001E5A4D0B|nr:hypothetical protein [Listeria marthii]MCD2255047.1 hypothetical protein [Listeria marthii]